MILELLGLVSAVVISVALVLVYFRKSYRNKFFVNKGFDRKNTKTQLPEFGIFDLADFLMIPIKKASLYVKSINGDNLIVMDTVTLVARGAYSGPTSTTYFVFDKNLVDIPVFTLRKKRFLESKHELRDAKCFDENSNVFCWTDTLGIEFLERNRRTCLNLFDVDDTLVIRGAKNKLLIWKTNGDYISTRKLLKYIDSISEFSKILD